MPTCQTVTYEFHHSSLDNILNTSAVPKMYFEVPLVEQSDSVSENLHRFHVDHSSNKSQTSDKSLVFTSIAQTIEQLGLAEESLISIIVPEDISKNQTLLTSQPVEQDHLFTEGENVDGKHISSDESDRSDETLEMEHSYCRIDFDRIRLCETIAKLQSKVALLEVQENVTLARLRCLEMLIGQLKQENLLSDEKLKIIDNCQKSFDFAVV
ncbi:THAP domain-containing protein 5 isoform X2 [Hyla sarda]|nr:THAP domain-containing protein 5 isoform X2 [Hyla sarda]XP_056429899.1 THAP domain-containing protein 5 isoform X2 [Hyla sarda]XP_056429901.1 THAP domain-containing protein 5 isoform X2 [Hyla sarda]